jgi:hypothetical protein
LIVMSILKVHSSQRLKYSSVWSHQIL